MLSCQPGLQSLKAQIAVVLNTCHFPWTNFLVQSMDSRSLPTDALQSDPSRCLLKKYLKFETLECATPGARAPSLRQNAQALCIRTSGTCCRCTHPITRHQPTPHRILFLSAGCGSKRRPIVSASWICYTSLA